MDPQHWEFPASAGDPDAVRSWFGSRVAHAAVAAGLGAELYALVSPNAGETIRLTVTRPSPGTVRLSVYGRQLLTPAARRSPRWGRLLVLADAAGTTADGAGAWAELPG